ncbi:hypothetical protein, partial [Serratia marcescens]|uniref:hypothetical protein n=1 Tax=Serratia marcescens TaxID=615 RepID=UPI00195546E2
FCRPVFLLVFCHVMHTFVYCFSLTLCHVSAIWYDELITFTDFIVATERQTHGHKGAESCRFRGRVHY